MILRLPSMRAAMSRPRRKALAGAVLAACLAVPGAESYAAPRTAGECKVQKFAEGVSGSSGWNPPQVGNVGSGVPVGTVLATRQLTIYSSFTYKDKTTPMVYVAHGAYWRGVPNDLPAIVPTNVPGVGLRVKPGGRQELKFENAIRAYASLGLDFPDAGKRDSFGSGIVVELIVTGTVPSGSHQVTDQDPSFPAARMHIRMAQMRPQPAAGDDITRVDGKIPGSGATCLDDAWFDVKELITIGGATPPLVTAVCEVDARYLGFGHEVPMGKVAADDFPSPGSRAGAARFSISLSHCAAEAKPRLAFYAGGPGRVPGMQALRLDPQPGYARNLGIVLTRQGDAAPLVIGAGAADLTFYSFPGLPIAPGATANFDLEAHYQRTDHDTPGQPGVTPGPANSSARFQVRYD
ncbi:hypothetical protein JL37_24695 [Achromobacter sp. RTa]|uniref:fimbrial protein n=1 Tax=Achromobacter sp. RTa TaxID=1532557 RepID=UPI00050FC7E0|nr:fimbrial protein [Achromobacter sp. RTa]KGD87783.1 hypothetical protein JL37_24695 [Achromobacter sp. RTa]